MSNNRLDKIIGIFDAASELEGTAREAFLTTTCDNDAALRAEVEALLREHDQAGAFLETPLLSDLAAPPPELAGRRIGPYELLRELGRGGMGIVYLARRTDDVYQKEVAVKLVWPHLQRTSAIRRFKQEREILARLDHPNIARLLDGGATEEGGQYVVMEYVNGLPLTEYCDAHKLDITARLKLFRTVCAAVEYAHCNLVVHRDLKPGNIFMTHPTEENAGVVKLLDFGIAKLLDPELRSVDTTQTGLHLLTPEYASPEQINGEAITTAGDVYSLGVVLYELLTGHRPHRLKSLSLPELARAIAETDPDRPSLALRRVVTETDGEGATRITRSPEVVSATREGSPDKLRRRLQGDIDNIALKAICKEPSERYLSTAQLSEDIEKHLTGRPVLAQKPTIAYKASKFIRRHKAGTATALMVFILVIVGIGALLERLKNAEIEAARERRKLYAANINLAHDCWKRGDYARMRSLLEQYEPERSGNAGREDLRGFEWRYLWRLLHRDRMTLRYQKEIHAMAVSTDGKMVATGMGDGAIILREVADGRELTRISGDGFIIRSLDFSPDGKKVVSGDAGGIACVWDVTTGKALTTARGHGNLKVLSVAFAPDGQNFATGGEDNTAKLWEATTGELKVTFSHPAWISAVAFSPNGQLLATGSLDRKVRLWELSTGKPRATLVGSQGDVWRLSFAGGGKLLVAGGLSQPAILWRVANGQMLTVFAATPQGSHALKASPDGRLLAIAGNDRTVRLFDINTHREIANFKGHRSYVGLSAFAPDGSWLATADNLEVKLWDLNAKQEVEQVRFCADCELRSIAVSPDGKTFVAGEGKGLQPDTTATRRISLWETATGKKINTFSAHKGAVYEMVFSPDGNKLASASEDGTAKLWELATSKEIAVFQHGIGCLVWTVAFSPDGRLLATGAYDGALRLWDAASSLEQRAINAHAGPVNSVAFSPSGECLASGSDESVTAHQADSMLKMWQLATDQELPAFREHICRVNVVRFSPDGKLLASANLDRTVRIRDAVTGRLLLKFEAHAEETFHLAFSPDSSRLVTVGGDHTVKVWDPIDGRELLTLEGHNGWTRSVAFSADGATLVSGSFDGIVRIWRAATEQEVKTKKSLTP